MSPIFSQTRGKQVPSGGRDLLRIEVGAGGPTALFPRVTGSIPGVGASRAVPLPAKKSDELFHSAPADLDARAIFKDHRAVTANQMLELLHHIEIHDGGS